MPLAGGLAAAQERPRPLQQAARSIVVVESALPADDMPFRLEPGEAAFTNTGFFVSSDGEVLTSLLGLAGCHEVSVLDVEGRRTPARLIALHQPSGLALLGTQLPDTPGLEPLARPPAEREWVLLATARPAGKRAAVAFSLGVVLSRQASALLQGVEWEGLLSASLEPGPGSAASPLIDTEGGLAGVLLSVGERPRDRALGPTAHPLNAPDCLVLPADQLSPILAELRQGTSRRLGWLGVALAREREGREGVRVEAVLEDSPAHHAGIRTGDILLQVDEQTIDGLGVMARRIVEAGPGREVEIRLLRGEEIKALRVELGERPLLICAGQRAPGEEHIQMRRRLSRLPSDPAELLEENRRLRRRIEELERRLRESVPD
jgi:S1-C subfamily serine protease